MESHNNMADFYQEHFESYYEKTAHIDPASFLEPLARQLSPGARILDIGCGSGRDMRWFKERGFELRGFERSTGLAGFARRHSGCEVVVGDFRYYDFRTMPADAVLLVGALVHIAHREVPGVLSRVTAGLKPGGKVLLTLKQGDGVHRDGFGRLFYLWHDTEIRGAFEHLGFSILDYRVQTSKVNADDTWLGYVLAKD